jgi:hypothetical protein
VDTAVRNKLIRDVLDARREYDKASEAKTRAGKRKKELELQLFEALEESGESSIKVDLGPGYGKRRIVTRATRFGQVLDREAAEAALLAEGYEREALIGSKLREQPLNQLVNERIDHGQELPEGIGFYERKGVTISSK